MTDNPYQVLNLGPQADSETIRKRYLELVRRHPPERDPERFAEIRAAYDQIRDPVVNLKARLFDLTASQTIESLAARRKTDVRSQRLPTDLLLSLAET
jgi:DnaJ-class molecular chaperone